MTTSLAFVASLSFAVAAPSVAVMPARGDDDGSAQTAIRAGLAGATMRLVSHDDVARLIASAAHNGIACDATDASCAARICAFGGLDFALVVDVSAPARAALSLFDCADGREVRNVAARLDDTRRNDGLAMLARAAVGEGDVRGRIEVVAAAGGVVVIDGVERGAAPPPLDVEAGAHDVRWRAPDGTERARSVEVPAAGSVRVAFDGEPKTAAATMTKTTTIAPSLAAGGLAAGAVLAIAGGVGAWAVAPSDRASVTARAYNDDVLIGRVLLGVGIVGGVLALVAGGALLVEGAP